MVKDGGGHCKLLATVATRSPVSYFYSATTVTGRRRCAHRDALHCLQLSVDKLRFVCTKATPTASAWAAPSYFASVLTSTGAFHGHPMMESRPARRRSKLASARVARVVNLQLLL